MTNEELDELGLAANAAWPKSRALSIGIVEHIDHGVNGYQTTTRHETFNSDVILTLIAAARENAALRERVKELELEMHNVRLAAASALSFGHNATPISSERMIERKEERLRQILTFCQRCGIEGSILRQ